MPCVNYKAFTYIDDVIHTLCLQVQVIHLVVGMHLSVRRRDSLEGRHQGAGDVVGRWFHRVEVAACRMTDQPGDVVDVTMTAIQYNAIQKIYSCVPNKHIVPNKSIGWQIAQI